jgi:hypothetical protein
VKKAWNAKFLYQCALMDREEHGLMYAANAHGNRCVGSSPKIPLILMDFAMPCDQAVRWVLVGLLRLWNAFVTAASQPPRRLLHVPCAAQVHTCLNIIYFRYRSAHVLRAALRSSDATF